MACDSSQKSINFKEIPSNIDTSRIVIELASKNKIRKSDLQQFNILPALEHHAERLSRLEEKILNGSQDIPRIVNIINDDFAANILVLANKKLSIDVDNLGTLVEDRAVDFLRKELKTNLFIEYSVIRTIQNYLKKSVPVVKTLIDGKAIAVADVELLLQQNRNPKLRLCTLNIIQIFCQLIRIQLAEVLAPIQKVIISSFTNITDYVLNFYIASESKNPLIVSITECTNAIILRVATVTVSVRETVNVCFNYILYGTSKGIDSSSSSSD